MPRAPKQCAHPECETRIIGRTHCDEHKPINWQRTGATRTGTAAHKKWRHSVLYRDRWTCQIKGPRCEIRATQADHIVNVAAGGPEFALSNGQAVCGPCHRAKTATEARSGRRP